MKIVLAVFAISLVWVALLLSIPRSEIVYNCALAEISPDFLVKIKQMCREKR